MTDQNARLNMIKQQLRTGDVLNEAILALYENILREEFVPAAMRPFAYSDMQIPLGHDQRMMTPLEEGRILQALRLKGDETILEVGTGTGFLTALLSRLCAKVITLDYFEEFTRMAEKNLKKYRCNNVELITGDACQGWLDKAPYDIIVMTGATETISDTLKLQILPGGKLLCITGVYPAMQCQLMELDHQNLWTQSMLFNTTLPPLINKFHHRKFIFQDPAA